MILNVVKIFLPTALAFAIGILITPTLTTFMYSHRLWKKNARDTAPDITNTDFALIHNKEAELSTPRVGGIIIWISVLITMSLIWIIAKITPSDLSVKLDFFSRNQTLVPIASLMFGALLGLVDDFLQIKGGKLSFANDGIFYRRVKIGLVTVVGLIIGYWFYFKLGMSGIAIPFTPNIFSFGFLFIPFFVIIMLAVFSTSVIDGLDGLAGGVFAIIFAAYATIAFGKHQLDIAALCGVISGSTLAFLWFNVPPARFYMGETGILGLTVILTVIAFLTDTVLILPLIAFPLVATTFSVIVQIISYKYFGHRRVFKIAPLHHHFRALGWSREKVVMRYWIVSIITAILGVVIALIS